MASNIESSIHKMFLQLHPIATYIIPVNKQNGYCSVYTLICTVKKKLAKGNVFSEQHKSTSLTAWLGRKETKKTLLVKGHRRIMIELCVFWKVIFLHFLSAVTSSGLRCARLSLLELLQKFLLWETKDQIPKMAL